MCGETLVREGERSIRVHTSIGIETAVVELTEYKENIFDCTVNNARNIVSAPSL